MISPRLLTTAILVPPCAQRGTVGGHVRFRAVVGIARQWSNGICAVAPPADSHLTTVSHGLPGVIVNSPFTIRPLVPSPALRSSSNCSCVTCS
jgi:hypothetical protein